MAREMSGLWRVEHFCGRKSVCQTRQVCQKGACKKQHSCEIVRDRGKGGDACENASHPSLTGVLGGLVAGSLTLIGGERESGSLHCFCRTFSRSGIGAYYMFPVEESASQLKLRANGLEKYQKTHLYCVKQILTIFSLRSRMYRHH